MQLFAVLGLLHAVVLDQLTPAVMIQLSTFSSAWSAIYLYRRPPTHMPWPMLGILSICCRAEFSCLPAAVPGQLSTNSLAGSDINMLPCWVNYLPAAVLGQLCTCCRAGSSICLLPCWVSYLPAAILGLLSTCCRRPQGRGRAGTPCVS